MTTDSAKAIEIDLSMSASANASSYFQKAKKARLKLASLKEAILETRAKLESAKAPAPQVEMSKRVKIDKPATHWYSKYHHFTTSKGKLAVAGKSASDNELLVARHLEPKDLFFHADVQGAAALILKDGQDASDDEKNEAAQFAASYSRAWKSGAGSVDVYCVGKDAVSKTSHGEFVPKGGFMIRGGRQWFRNTPLQLAIYLTSGAIEVVPSNLRVEGKRAVIVPGSSEKPEAAKQVMRRLGLAEGSAASAIEPLLPGPSSVLPG